MRINEAVGEFLRRYRNEHGLTMDDVADASRRYGSGWSSATISQMEKGGSKADSLPVLLVLAQSLSDLTGEELTLAGLLGLDSPEHGEGTQRIAVTDSMKIAAGELEEVLAGKSIHPLEFDPNRPDAAQSRWTRAVRNHLPPGDWSKIFFCPTSAERKTAAKLGVDDAVVSAWCLHLYGRSMDAEARRRAGDGATPQKRGRATRVLTREIEIAMKKRADDLRTSDDRPSVRSGDDERDSGRARQKTT